MSDNQKVFRERFALLEEETEMKLKKKDKVYIEREGEGPSSGERVL